MTSQQQFYEERLYPLQDGILIKLKELGAPFYLTGGTALSRFYYSHRYSTDLDLFSDNSLDFQESVQQAFDYLRAAGYYWNEQNNYLRTENYVTLYIEHDRFDVSVKIDFVEDLVPHFGALSCSGLYHQIDSVRNILSNKLSAIFRYSIKDVCDIREAALHESFSWFDIVTEAREKDAGIDLLEVAKVLEGTPESEFDRIIWCKEAPTWKAFMADVHQISHDMLSSGANSLNRYS